MPDQKENKTTTVPTGPTYAQKLGAEQYAYYLPHVAEIKDLENPNDSYDTFGLLDTNGVKLGIITLPKALAVGWANAILKKHPEYGKKL